jgi:membrane protein DedA with SNARE-associated domain
MEDVIAQLMRIDALYVYASLFLVSYIENLFPPFPSDVVVVFAGSLIALDQGNAPLSVLLATAGSTLGFMTMYGIGKAVDQRWLETGRLRFISIAMVHKLERWFQRYGFWIIVTNRFLAGTRAAVSFCAGMSRMRLGPTAALSAASALVWNVILIWAGYSLGRNWRAVADYLRTYSLAVSILIAALVAGGVLVTLLRRRRERGEARP